VERRALFNLLTGIEITVVMSKRLVVCPTGELVLFDGTGSGKQHRQRYYESA
jgi:hypothetical protein